MIKNVYLILAGFFLISFTACKKTPNSGNDTGTTTTTTGIPSGASDGVTLVNSGTSAIFNLYAPGKTTVSVIGDFNSWVPTAMTKTTDGTRFWVQINNLNPNTEYSYQYEIDGTLKVADPYSHKVLDPVNDPGIPASVYPNLKAYPTGKTTGEVSDFFANDPAYTWQTKTFTRPAQKNLVVYELLVRDFVATHSYQTLTDTLNYIASLGVNAIELMPVNEFEANDSWGYNSNFMFALDKYYGTPNAYKAFIDACHARGIAVIQDIVLEDQFGSSPMVQMYATSSGAPATNSPWFDPQNMHPDAVGYQLNHSLPATQYFAENVMKYWMQEYHIDGYRFDEAKGYTQVNSGTVSNDATEAAWAAYDASRVALWTKYNAYMKSLDPTFYVILEMFSANTEEAQYASQGMMMWTNLSTPGEQATMGYATNPTWDISGLFYDQYGFPSTGTSPYGLVAYFESHDQERLQFKNEAYGNSSGNYDVQTLATGLARDELGAVFMFSSPGPKMVWQAGELGFDVSYYSDPSDPTIDKPFNWTYNTVASRRHLYGVYQKMINMKIKNPVFTTTNYKYDLQTDAVKYIQLVDPTGAANVVVVGNFDVVTNTATIPFTGTGTWIDNITGSTINVTTANMSMTLAPGEYHVYSNNALIQ